MRTGWYQRPRRISLAAGLALVVLSVAGGAADGAVLTAGPGPTPDTTALATQEASIQARPDTALADLQPVALTGMNFPAGVALSVSQCHLRDGLTGGICHGASRLDVVTDPAGGFSASIHARRIIVEAGGRTDCAAAPGVCGFVTTSGPGGQLVVAAATFDPDRPPDPPTVSVRPGADLTDGQGVTVSGRGFIPGPVTVAQCLTDAFGLASCGRDTRTETAADRTGLFTVDVTVRASITDAVTGRVTTCAGSERCAVVAANRRGASEQARVPLPIRPVVLGAVTTRPGELPRTGAGPASRLALLGAALVALGLAVAPGAGAGAGARTRPRKRRR